MKMKAVTSQGNAMFMFFVGLTFKISVYGFCILTVLVKLVCWFVLYIIWLVFTKLQEYRKHNISTGKSPIRRPSPDSGTSLNRETICHSIWRHLFLFLVWPSFACEVRKTLEHYQKISIFFYIITVHSKIFTVRISL